MGVINEALAANATANTNGLDSRPNCTETEKAIGTMIIAVATFGDIYVSTIVLNSMVPSSMNGCKS